MIAVFFNGVQVDQNTDFDMGGGLGRIDIGRIGSNCAYTDVLFDDFKVSNEYIITPGSGTYELPQYVTISCATEGATIRYTTDGSDPDQNSAVYNDEIIPVTQSMTIKALGGGDFGTPPAGQVGVADGSGLNNIGLLVTVTGRVTTKGADWFMIDDGSGVGVKVKGTVPAGTPYVTVKGISSCEKDASGNIQRVILATEMLENVQ